MLVETTVCQSWRVFSETQCSCPQLTFETLAINHFVIIWKVAF